MRTTLWMSGEIQSDIADEYRLARKDVEVAVNAALGASNYGDGLSKWSLIAIILEEDHPDFDEVKRYRKKERNFEFRLKISHAEFKATDSVGRRKLIVEALLRSIAEMRRLAIRSIDSAKLESDVRELAAAKGWT
jgi:Immunity protein 44